MSDWQPVTEDDMPENYAVDRIIEILMGMDGMTNCTALGILENCKFILFEMIHCKNEKHVEKETCHQCGKELLEDEDVFIDDTGLAFHANGICDKWRQADE